MSMDLTRFLQSKATWSHWLVWSDFPGRKTDEIVVLHISNDTYTSVAKVVLKDKNSFKTEKMCSDIAAFIGKQYGIPKLFQNGMSFKRPNANASWVLEICYS